MEVGGESGGRQQIPEHHDKEKSAEGALEISLSRLV